MNEQNRGTLYLVPTPIGNMQDMTYRAVQVLQSVNAIAAEDTRRTGQLLKALDIQQPLISYHEHNKEEKGGYLLQMLLDGKDIACVSDAGMPAISDPGADLAKLAIDAEVDVVPLPGPNAALTALIASGLPAYQFTFVGFLPKRKKHRLEALDRLRSRQDTLLLYEAPHRLREVLEDMYQVLGDRHIAICRELTKRFETFYRTHLGAVIADDTFINYKGEFVLVVEGASDPETVETVETEVDYIAKVMDLVTAGQSKKDAIRQVAKHFGISRRELYNKVEEYIENHTKGEGEEL